MPEGKYPAIYHREEEQLETGRESAIALLEKGMEESVVRRVSIPLVKTVPEAPLEQKILYGTEK